MQYINLFFNTITGQLAVVMGTIILALPSLVKKILLKNSYLDAVFEDEMFYDYKDYKKYRSIHHCSIIFSILSVAILFILYFYNSILYSSEAAFTLYFSILISTVYPAISFPKRLKIWYLIAPFSLIWYLIPFSFFILVLSINFYISDIFHFDPLMLCQPFVLLLMIGYYYFTAISTSFIFFRYRLQLKLAPCKNVSLVFANDLPTIHAPIKIDILKDKLLITVEHTNDDTFEKIIVNKADVKSITRHYHKWYKSDRVLPWGITLKELAQQLLNMHYLFHMISARKRRNKKISNDIYTMLIDNNCNESIAITGFLYSIVRDTSISIYRILDLFGDDIATMIKNHADRDKFKKEDLSKYYQDLVSRNSTEEYILEIAWTLGALRAEIEYLKKKSLPNNEIVRRIKNFYEFSIKLLEMCTSINTMQMYHELETLCDELTLISE